MSILLNFHWPKFQRLVVIILAALSQNLISAMTTPSRGLVPTSLGLVHYTTTGDSSSTLLPIVGFHMSPRSVDEYKEIMEACQGRQFVAMDEFGYGGSDSPSKSCTLDEIADCFMEVLTHLGIKRCIVAGSLMGCYLALSLASRYPDKIVGVVCSNLYYFQQAGREKAVKEESERGEGPTPDSWELKDDGTHIKRYAKGIHIQDGGAFPLKETCGKVSCPVVCINGAGAVGFFDMIGMDMTGQLKEAVGFFKKEPEQVVIQPPGASINMLNENAKEWLEHVTAFAKTIE